MITITNIRNVDHAAYDEVWAIVRSLQNSGKMRHVPELSSSWKLFRQYLHLRNTGTWNPEAFQDLYVPTFLQAMQTAAVKKKLNELVWLDRQGRRIVLVCFCSDEATCHRSIIAGMNEIIEKMRKDGYPYKIKGNGGYIAVLCDIQPLFNGDYMGIYCYPRGECCHDLMEIRMHFEIIEQ